MECQQTKSAFVHIGCWCNRNLICKLFPSQFPSKTCVGNFSVAESYSLQRRRQRERRSSDRNMIQREQSSCTIVLHSLKRLKSTLMLLDRKFTVFLLLFLLSCPFLTIQEGSASGCGSSGQFCLQYNKSMEVK